jgi:hypothetical protein
VSTDPGDSKPPPKNHLKRLEFKFWLCLILSLIALDTYLHASWLDSHWKQVISGSIFMVVITLTISTILQWQKHQDNDSDFLKRRSLISSLQRISGLKQNEFRKKDVD